MNIVKTKTDLYRLLDEQRSFSNRIGLVPTMGSLHKGHLSLIEVAKRKSDFVWVTIFINPTQFNDVNDFKSYPKEIDGDIKKIRSISKEINIFIPSVDEMYPDNIPLEKFNFGDIDNILEGKFRPGHFNGVATIVKKLFEIFEPCFVFFGEKDFQQTLIIKKIIYKFFPEINIIICPTIRDKNGLALSSRNKLISKNSFSKCGIIFETLQFAKANYIKIDFVDLLVAIKSKIETIKNFELEYFEIRDEENLVIYNQNDYKKSFRGFISVKVEGVRLIDNLPF